MKTSRPCSEHCGGRLVVLEGMPGAGKTTTARALYDAGQQVLGEYTSSTAATVPLYEHPVVDDDDAHQDNWLRKAAQATQALATRHPRPVVFVDRDWLSSLAYAYSIAHTDHGLLLTQRIHWADNHLSAGILLPADVYAIFDLDATTSLRRRAQTLRHAHPWSRPDVLRRLRTFYRDPSAVVAQVCPTLAARLRRIQRIDVAGTDHPTRQLAIVHSLGEAH